MTLAEVWISNPLIFEAIKENMSEIISIAEFTPNVKLNLHILSSLKRIFEYDEKNTDEVLLEQFKSINGFEMTYAFEQDKSNPELAEKAEKFNENFFGDLDDLDIENLNKSIIGGDDDDDHYEEDQPNYGDLYYKKKGTDE